MTIKFIWERFVMYWKNIGRGIGEFLRGFDILVNAIFGGDGRETISSRIGKHKDSRGVKIFAEFVDFLFFWDKEHTDHHQDPDVGDGSDDNKEVWR